ncbi:MAG: NAD(P)/FAD-dependent oxidoreductase [Bacteroidia bacterium]|nr:NAD(P)/FAD-dependent oxidoreductase [Bacteroidia bacterium]
MFDVIIVGGGVHGVLTALYLHSENDALRIAIFEKAKQLLPTYTEFESFLFHDQICSRKELTDMIDENGIRVFKSSAITAISLDTSNAHFELKTRRAHYKSPKVVFCAGKDSQILELLKDFSIAIDEVLPAAFPLESNDPRIVGLGKVVIPVQLSWVKMSPPKKKIRIKLVSAPASNPIKQVEGNIQMQEKMISGPAVYQLTQFISAQQDPFPDLVKICINWVPGYQIEGLVNYLTEAGQLEGHKTIIRTPLFALPRRLWTSIALAAGIDREAHWEALDEEQYEDLAEQLINTHLITKPRLSRKGLIAFRGGVSSTAVDTSGQSLKYPGMFFAGTIRSDHLTHLKGNNKQLDMSLKTLAQKIAV